MQEVCFVVTKGVRFCGGVSLSKIDFRINLKPSGIEDSAMIWGREIERRTSRFWRTSAVRFFALACFMR